MVAIRPQDLSPVDGGIVNPGAALITDEGYGVRRATPAQVVDSGAPISSQAEAEAGVVNTGRMTALRVKQAIDAQALSADILALPTGAGMVGAGETTLNYQIQATPGFYGIVDDPNAASPGLAINQAVALQEWLTACVTNGWTPYAPHPIRVHSASTLTYNPPITGRHKSADLNVGNMMIYSSATTGFIVGSASTNVDFATLDMPGVIRHTVDWSGTVSDLNAAVVIYSSYKCTINRNVARFFTKGYLFYSRSAGFSNNTINGGQMASNRYNEVFLCDGDLGINADYCNENNIFGADYNEFSTTQAITGNRYHTVFTAINGGYRGSNNNRFWGPCYQGLADAPSGQAIPIWLDGCGGFNNWYSPRWENGDGPFMYADSKAVGVNPIYAIYNEIVHKGYDGGTSNQQFRIQQVGGAFGNIYRGINTTEDDWHSGDLRDAVYAGGSAGVYRIKDGFYLNYSGPAARQLNLESGFYNNIHGVQFSSAGVFARFDTTKIKNFLIQSGCLKGFEGRLFIEAFDATGARLTGTITDATGTEMYVKSAGLVPSGNFGGGYNGQSDNSDNFAYIAVRDEVAQIGIAYVAGTKNIVCSNFSVRGFSTYNIATTEIVSGGIRPINPLFDGAVTRTSAANPATAGRYGFYSAGQTVGNGGAASGQPSGWVCTTAGALGWPFAINTAFSVPGQVVMCGASGERAYYVKTPGTTSGAGTGPSGTTPGTDYTDGTVVFRYISPKAAFLPLANIP